MFKVIDKLNALSVSRQVIALLRALSPSLYSDSILRSFIYVYILETSTVVGFHVVFKQSLVPVFLPLISSSIMSFHLPNHLILLFQLPFQHFITLYSLSPSRKNPSCPESLSSYLNSMSILNETHIAKT